MWSLFGFGGSKPNPQKHPRKIAEPVFNEKECFFENPDNVADILALSKLDISGCNAVSEISTENLTQWEQKLKADPKNRLVQNALAHNDLTNVIAVSGSSQSLRNRYFFNLEIETIGSPSYLNNQKSSGRCWIFATCNVLRTHVIKTYNLDPASFQLSQSYLFFYDKLEKANYFLENVIDTADEDLESRLLQALFAGAVSDGGQWDMIVNVIEKYGVVPNEVFPDNAQAVNTGKLNYFLTNKLREYALVLRRLVNEGVPKAKVTAAKNAMNKEIYAIIALALGTPPKPEDSFTWEFSDKAGKHRFFETSPVDFYRTHVKYNVSKRFSLINDPRNKYNALYTVDRLNNVHGGKPIEYVNLDLPAIKAAAIAMLRNNEPIFFGSDVGKFNDNATGILDTEAYDYNLTFNTSMRLLKLDRLKTGSSAMTHAMTITAVHLDPATGKPIRWKIENSWGDAVGEKGYFVMTDSWFDEYVFQIVTTAKYVDKAVVDLWKSKKYNVLPFFDPMGALA